MGESISGKRYEIQAKRRNRDDEKWSAWAVAQSYPEAERHRAYCEHVGYSSRIVENDEVRALWLILGEDKTAETDAILNAGFRKMPVGQWEETGHISVSKNGRVTKYATHTCSVCKTGNGKRKTSYCPACGARMLNADVTTSKTKKERK